MITLLCLAVLCLGAALVMWRGGENFARVASKYMALLAVVWVIAAAMGVYTQFGSAWRTRTVQVGAVGGKAATVIPGSVGVFVLYQLIWACMACLFLVAGAEIAGAAWHTHWPLALLLSCAGLCSASAPALALTGGLGRVRVSLTSDEIACEGWSSRTSMPWTDVTQVMTASDPHPVIILAGSEGARWCYRAKTPVWRLGRAARQMWRLDRRLRGYIVVECARLAADERRLHDYLTFYLEHPGARGELGTSRSRDRWRAMML